MVASTCASFCTLSASVSIIKDAAWPFQVEGFLESSKKPAQQNGGSRQELSLCLPPDTLLKIQILPGLCGVYLQGRDHLPNLETAG